MLPKRPSLNNQFRPYTVSEWCDSYLLMYKKRVSTNTLRDYELVLRHFCETFGERFVCDILPYELQDFFDTLEGRSFSYVHKMHFLVKAVFKSAVVNGLADSDPSLMLMMPPTTRGTHRVITDSERTALLSVAEHHYAKNYIYLMLFCGLRPSETVRVQGKDIDAEHGILHVRGTKTKSADRLVPIPDRIIASLSGFKSEQYVVVGRKGKPLKSVSVGGLWDDIKRSLPIKTNMRPYDLRHTFCTDLCNANVPIAVACKIMGHADTQMVMNVYYHATEKSVLSAKKLLDGNQF